MTSKHNESLQDLHTSQARSLRDMPGYNEETHSFNTVEEYRYARYLRLNGAQLVPVVGQAASYGYGSDSYPAKVVAVSPSAAKVTLEEPSGDKLVVHRNQHGRYRSRATGFVTFGVAHYYLDPYF